MSEVIRRVEWGVRWATDDRPLLICNSESHARSTHATWERLAPALLVSRVVEIGPWAIQDVTR